MFNMKKDYTKIKLRDFRHNLTQLKDSLASGEVYEVVDHGKVLAYFVPPNYEIKAKKKRGLTQEEHSKIIRDAMSSIKLKDEIKDEKDYAEAYRKLLIKKYLK